MRISGTGDKNTFRMIRTWRSIVLNKWNQYSMITVTICCTRQQQYITWQFTELYHNWRVLFGYYCVKITIQSKSVCSYPELSKLYIIFATDQASCIQTFCVWIETRRNAIFTPTVLWKQGSKADSSVQLYSTMEFRTIHDTHRYQNPPTAIQRNSHWVRKLRRKFYFASYHPNCVADQSALVSVARPDTQIMIEIDLRKILWSTNIGALRCKPLQSGSWLFDGHCLPLFFREVNALQNLQTWMTLHVVAIRKSPVKPMRDSTGCHQLHFNSQLKTCFKFILPQEKIL